MKVKNDAAYQLHPNFSIQPAVILSNIEQIAVVENVDSQRLFTILDMVNKKVEDYSYIVDNARIIRRCLNETYRQTKGD